MKTINREPPPASVRIWLSYDPATGEFTWLKTRGRGLKGAVAGIRDKDGYLAIRIEGRSYRAHRLAWFFATGEWPEQQIDHLNLIKDDNRLSNLRLATPSQQSANRPSYGTRGKGVSLQPSGRYRASLRYHGRTLHLGMFKTAEEARAAYAAAADLFFGEFARAA